MKQKIIEEAERLFWKYGVKSVTLDDIAKRLGISKKTIYQHFTDKEDIVYQVLVYHFDGTKKDADCCRILAHNPVEEVLKLSELMRKHAGSINPSLMFDVERHYPKAWAVYKQFKEEVICASIKENLQWGIEEGLYRSNMDLEVVARMRLECIHMGLNEDVFPPTHFDFIHVQMQLLHHFIRGILTEKGFTIYNQFNHEL